jgi:hypothetical protein
MGARRSWIGMAAMAGIVFVLLSSAGTSAHPTSPFRAAGPALGESGPLLIQKTPSILHAQASSEPTTASSPSASLAKRPAASVSRASPHPASKIDPLLGYSKEPAPMGIADFGVTSSASSGVAYEYASSMFQGTALVNSMDVSIPFHSTILKVTAFELNAMVVLQRNGTNYTYWIQNGLHVNASSRQFTIGGAYVWNFSSPSSHLSSSEVRGNSSSMLASDTYYFIPGCGVFPGQCSTLTWPGTLTGRIVTATSGGIPYVDYQYDLGAGWVTYDNVSFLHMTGATDVGFVVDGYHSTPYAGSLFYDAEWDWVAAGGGGTSVVKGSHIDMSLDFWNGRNFQAVPNAWDFGGDTGETSSNVTEAAVVEGSGAAPAASVTNGAGSLGVLYNRSTVGFLNVSIPFASPQTLQLNGTAIAIPDGGINLTLTGGTYAVSLQNYSNTSQPITITPGATTYLNLSGAGQIAFVETGLPAGTPWGITLGSYQRSATATTLAFNLPNGTYLINYTAVPGFFRNNTDPILLTMPTPSPVVIAWTQFTYTVPFTEQGLPASTPWWVSASSSVERGDGTTINVSAPNGSTPFVVGSAYEFVASPSEGAIDVNHGSFAPVDVLFSYRPTFVAGSVSPSNATITLDGVAEPVSGGAFNITVIPGVHTLVANASGYTPQTIQLNASAGNVTPEEIVLVAHPAHHGGGGGTPTTSSSNTSSGLPLFDIIVGVAIAGAAAVVVLALLFVQRSKSR